MRFQPRGQQARMSSASGERGIRAALLVLAGAAFALAALLYNELILGHFAQGGLRRETIAAVRTSETAFAATAVALFACAALVAARAHSHVRPGDPRATKLLLALLSVVVPLAIAELALRPLWLARDRHATTTIFMRDADLGWRMRPGADDVWDGVRIQVNAKGLRGPELPYEKTPGTSRIVWLGDSVAFGHGLGRYDQTYPHLVETRLEHRLGLRIETVNAGVGGYSPWQEKLWLASEGVRYAPDLVVISFVLNDAVEPFELARFGGSGEGFHLTRTASRWRLEERSALFYYLRLLLVRARYGADVKAGAKRDQTLGVRALVERPDREAVRGAWRMTLEDLAGIVSTCRDHGIGVALVVFPFAFQLADPASLSAPQRTLATFAQEHQVPELDLLPLLAGRLAADGRKAEDFFLDEDHPSELGATVAAELISDFFAEAQLLAPLTTPRAAREPG